jgi:hypothetical protein
MKQTSTASLAFTKKKKQTRRERFLAEMDTVAPWLALFLRPGGKKPDTFLSSSERVGEFWVFA